jgi:hypothetical protein
MKAGRWNFQFVTWPGIEPLRVWNLPGTESEFWRRAGTLHVQRRRTAGVPEADIGREVATEVALITHRLHHGEAGPELSSLLGFSLLSVSGGLCEVPGFEAALRMARLPFEVVTLDGALGGILGARAFLSARGVDCGLAVEIGQSAMKLEAFTPRSEETRIVARDFSLAPVVFEAERRLKPVEDLRRLGVRSIEAIAAILAQSMGSRVHPDPVLALATPFPVGPEGVPGESSYCNWEGDREFFPLLAKALDTAIAADPRAAKSPWASATEVPVFVAQDIAFTAFGTRSSLGEKLPALTCVLSLGYGPAAASLRP